MDLPGAKQVRIVTEAQPRTWRWLKWHAWYLLLAVLFYVVASGVLH